MATITWLAISGGVIIADSVRTSTKDIFRYFRIISGEIRPIFVKKYTNIGNSNIKPAERTDARIRAV